MINISELLAKIKHEGYNEELAEAKLCQDIVLLLLSKSTFNKNITIKGGVVMRSLSNDVRRATTDLDLDFIRYPITESGIRNLISKLNGIEGIRIKIVGKIEDLKHQDYKGKRIFVDIEDDFKNYLSSKIDIGIHKYLSLKQDEYCFDISTSTEGASLLINSKEQIFTEKLKSLLKFGSLSTRFKDVYDLYFLMNIVNKSELLKTFELLIFNDPKTRENNLPDIICRIKTTFNNSFYLEGLQTSKKNWLETENETVLNGIIEFLNSLKNE